MKANRTFNKNGAVFINKLGVKEYAIQRFNISKERNKKLIYILQSSGIIFGMDSSSFGILILNVLYRSKARTTADYLYYRGACYLNII